MSRRFTSHGAQGDTSPLINCLISLGSQVNCRGATAVASLDMSFLEARVVQALGQAPARHAAAIAHELGVDPAAISRTLKGLKARGIVGADAERRLALTEAGTNLYASLSQLLEERHRLLMRVLTLRERVQLLEYLRRLQRTLPMLPAMSDERSGAGPVREFVRKSSWRTLGSAVEDEGTI